MEEVEEKVLSELPKLSAVALEAACEAVQLAVLDAVKGNKKALRKLLTNYLDTDDDDREAEFRTLYTLFFPPNETPDSEADDEDEESDDAEEAAADVKPDIKMKSSKTVLKKGELKDEGAGASGFKKASDKKQLKSSERVDRSTERPRVAVTRMLRKDFKLSGMIGGTGENALTYVGLQFEIDKGRKLGHSDEEMCSAVISKVADKELRSYFVTEANIKLDEVMDMLKSVCTEEKSSKVFTTFTNDKQGRNEKAISFITRVLKLKKKVMKLSREERRSYDEEMLAERSFEVILGGLRDENIRSALRDKLKGDVTIEDKIVLAYASNVIAAEEERKLKLFGKTIEDETDEIDVNEVLSEYSRDSSRTVRFEDKKQTGAKKKLNPFTEIEELRNQMVSREDKMTAQLNEIKQLVIGQKKESDNKKPEDKPPNKCPACWAANKWRCYHCWQCGDKSHKITECLENA